jgi:hypothetical protein
MIIENFLNRSFLATTPAAAPFSFGTTAAPAANIFGATTATNPSPFGATTSAAPATTSIFGTAQPSTSIFGSTTTTSPFGARPVTTQPTFGKYFFKVISKESLFLQFYKVSEQ